MTVQCGGGVDGSEKTRWSLKGKPADDAQGPIERLSRLSVGRPGEPMEGSRGAPIDRPRAH